MRKDVKITYQTNSALSESGESLERMHLTQGTYKNVWERALANDLCRLSQVVGSRIPN